MSYELVIISFELWVINCVILLLITHNSKLITKNPFPTKHDENLLLPLLLKQKLAVYPQKVNLSTQYHAKFHEKLLVIFNHQFVCTFPHGWTKSEEKNYFCL